MGSLSVVSDCNTKRVVIKPPRFDSLPKYSALKSIPNPRSSLDMETISRDQSFFRPTRSLLLSLAQSDIATTLTGFHFSVTAVVGWASNAAGYSVSKLVPLWDLLWFSIVANLSITAMNFSFMLNSVGFYQISKLSMIPVACVMEWILHSKNYSPRVITAVVVVAFGVGVCTVTDVEINTKGFLCACVAVFCMSLQQIVEIAGSTKGTKIPSPLLTFSITERTFSITKHGASAFGINFAAVVPDFLKL